MASNLNKYLFTEAKKYIPGGVNSPVRSFKAVGGTPIFIARAKGSKIYSEDGRQFIDYCQGFGSLILGHSHPEVLRILKKRLNKGSIFGAPTKQETELAKLIAEVVSSIESVRLTNSGTEAVMTAIRLGRAFTGRSKIIKFSGSYHGHADYLLDSRGVPGDFTKHTLVAPYNNINKVEGLVLRHKNDMAAIIVEPVASNMGVVLPKNNFLQDLRKIANKYKIVLIFDEVVTGFRLALGGAQSLFKIQPDLTCLGKIIGGGFPIGALGGKKEIMGLLAPLGNVYQAGTFSGNPVSVSAGFSTLEFLRESRPYRKLEVVTSELCRGIKELAKRYGLRIQMNFIGSMFSIFFAKEEIADCNTAGNQDQDLFKKFYQGLLKEGVYFSPSGFEANFLSTAHIRQDIERTLKAVKKVFLRLREA